MLGVEAPPNAPTGDAGAPNVPKVDCVAGAGVPNDEGVPNGEVGAGLDAAPKADG